MSVNRSASTRLSYPGRGEKLVPRELLSPTHRRRSRRRHHRGRHSNGVHGVAPPEAVSEAAEDGSAPPCAARAPLSAATAHDAAAGVPEAVRALVLSRAHAAVSRGTGAL